MPKYFRKYRYTQILKKQIQLHVNSLHRNVNIDIYHPQNHARNKFPAIIFNDAHELTNMNISNILRKHFQHFRSNPCIVIGIHSSENRNHELGTTHFLEANGHGTQADAYQQFILNTLIPKIKELFPSITDTYMAGFSLGGLSALDICINHPKVFKGVGVFSGALWWRDRPFSLGAPNAHMIIPKKIQLLEKTPKSHFWFQTGTLEETSDRDNNGVIDVIDDTLLTISALRQKGVPQRNIYYLEIKGGKHQWETWASAMASFLRFCSG